MEKIVIVGAGPAGLFASYELINSRKDFDITILDKGKDIDKRNCPSPGKCTRNCKPCGIINGVGGAGLFSDGKLIFSTEIGSNLNYLIGETKNQELVNYVQDILEKNHNIKLANLNYDEIKKIRVKASTNDIKAIFANSAHVGTDNLVNLIKNFKEDLQNKGVKFISNKNVNQILETIVKTDDGEKYPYDSVLLAPGRVGSEWLEKIIKKHNIEYKYNPLDIGVRVEVNREITDYITDIYRDMKFYIQTETYRDWVRTFCTCPGGKVAREKYENFNLVNGHSLYGDIGKNTNFAFLVNLRLTKPLGNSNEYGRVVAQTLNAIGQGDPVVQRLGDLKVGRRTYKEKIINDFNKSVVKPSLQENIVYGDLGMALPYRILLNVVEGLEKLNTILPGVANKSTLLYAPEIKFHALSLKTNQYLQTSKEKIYAAGDGVGWSRGIIGAAASGILAARGMIKNYK